MAKKNKVMKAVATVTVFSVCTRALAFIFKIYLSRTLGAEAIGLYQISLSMFYLFASLSASGVPLVLSRKTAEDDALEKKSDFSLFSSALILGICISVSTALLLFIAKPLLPRILSDEKTLPLFLIMAPAIVSTTIYSVIRSWFWGKKKFTYFSITETVEEMFRILFSILFVSGVISGISGAYGIAVAFTVSDVLVAIILLIMFFAKGGRITKPSKIKEIFKPALPVTAMRVFGSLIGTLLAVMLPARLMAAGMSVSEATASYGRIAGMANPLILAPNAIISSLAIVLIPEMSASGAKHDYISLNRHINTGINFAFLISGIFMAGYFALGREITLTLFKDGISGEYLRWATIMMLPMCINQMSQSALNSVGMETKAFKNYIIGTLLMIAAIYFLPRYIGIYASIAASLVSMLTTGTLNLLSMKKRTGFSPAFVKLLVLIPIFTVPCAYFTSCLYGVVQGAGIFGLIIALVGGAGMYVVLCLLTEVIDIRGFIKMRMNGGRTLSL